MLLDYLLSGGKISLTDVLIRILSSLAVIFLTMPVHEYAHALAGTKLGDPTPKYTGRLSLNPFRHIDYIGALLIILVGFGYAKPVQINPRNFDNPKTGMAMVAFAGPLANLMMALISLFGMNFASSIGLNYLELFFDVIATINISLAIFNLIPIPPLDGSRILNALLPDRTYYKLMQYERQLYFLVIILIVTGVLRRPLSYLTEVVYNGLNWLAGLAFQPLM